MGREETHEVDYMTIEHGGPIGELLLIAHQDARKDTGLGLRQHDAWFDATVQLLGVVQRLTSRVDTLSGHEQMLWVKVDKLEEDNRVLARNALKHEGEIAVLQEQAKARRDEAMVFEQRIESQSRHLTEALGLVEELREKAASWEAVNADNRRLCELERKVAQCDRDLEKAAKMLSDHVRRLDSVEASDLVLQSELDGVDKRVEREHRLMELMRDNISAMGNNTTEMLKLCAELRSFITSVQTSTIRSLEAQDSRLDTYFGKLAEQQALLERTSKEVGRLAREVGKWGGSS
jgi:chromosome segregation ATPase